MNSLRILESDGLKISIRSVYSLRLTFKNDLLHLIKLSSFQHFDFVFLLILFRFFLFFKELVIIQKTLFPIENCPCVSALHEFFNEPLKHWINLTVIKTLDLMCSYHEWTLHFSTGNLDFFREFDFLTHSKIIFEFDINIIVGTSYTPTHASKDLIERVDVQSSSEITSCNQEILDILK